MNDLVWKYDKMNTNIKQITKKSKRNNIYIQNTEELKRS